jgi:hypothetical protein
MPKKAIDNDSLRGWLLGVASVVTAYIGNRFYPGWGELIVLTSLVFGSVLVFAPKTWRSRAPFWGLFTVLFLVHLLIAYKLQPYGPFHASLIFIGVGEVIVLAVVFGVVLDKLMKPAP